MKPLIDVSVIVLTVLMMAALGLDLTGRDFARVRRHPGLVLGGLVGPLLLLPPIALALIWLLRPAPDVGGRRAADRRLSDRRDRQHLQLSRAGLARPCRSPSPGCRACSRR